nr:transcriptional regulator [Nocardia cyriacigeorgica]
GQTATLAELGEAMTTQLSDGLGSPIRTTDDTAGY